MCEKNEQLLRDFAEILFRYSPDKGKKIKSIKAGYSETGWDGDVGCSIVDPYFNVEFFE